MKNANISQITSTALYPSSLSLVSPAIPVSPVPRELHVTSVKCQQHNSKLIWHATNNNLDRNNFLCSLSSPQSSEKIRHSSDHLASILWLEWTLETLEGLLAPLLSGCQHPSDTRSHPDMCRETHRGHCHHLILAHPCCIPSVQWQFHDMCSSVYV